MGNPFKAGDRIRCLRNAHGSYSEGTEYIVAQVYSDTVYTTLDDGGSNSNGWYYEHFEPVTPKTPKVIRKSLLIEAQPEGGFLVTEPCSNPFNERKHLAAFSRLSEALGFIEEAMA